MFTRRRFLAGAIPGLALVTGGLSVAGYRQGGCPLTSSGLCVGPCSALVDRDGDLFCDRIGARVQAAPEPAASEGAAASAPAPQVASEEPVLPVEQEAPAELPTPDKSAAPIESAPPTQPQPRQTQPKPTAQARPARPKPAQQAELVVLCPFGLVNDRYPGRCGRYVDRNGNDICDLSEPRAARQSNP